MLVKKLGLAQMKGSQHGQNNISMFLLIFVSERHVYSICLKYGIFGSSNKGESVWPCFSQQFNQESTKNIAAAIVQLLNLVIFKLVQLFAA